MALWTKGCFACSIHDHYPASRKRLRLRKVSSPPSCLRKSQCDKADSKTGIAALPTLYAWSRKVESKEPDKVSPEDTHEPTIIPSYLVFPRSIWNWIRVRHPFEHIGVAGFIFLDQRLVAGVMHRHLHRAAILELERLHVSVLGSGAGL